MTKTEQATQLLRRLELDVAPGPYAITREQLLTLLAAMDEIDQHDEIVEGLQSKITDLDEERAWLTRDLRALERECNERRLQLQWLRRRRRPVYWRRRHYRAPSCQA
jgi:phage shock protein A